MSKKNNLKVKLFIIGFVAMFFLLYPMQDNCVNDCFLLPLVAGFVVGTTKIYQYNFFKGNAFYGWNGINTHPARSTKEDSSGSNQLKRYYNFITLVLIDGLFVYIVIKESWLFN